LRDTAAGEERDATRRQGRSRRCSHAAAGLIRRPVYSAPWRAGGRAKQDPSARPGGRGRGCERATRGRRSATLPDGVTPHALRRTFATVLHALGTPPPQVCARWDTPRRRWRWRSTPARGTWPTVRPSGGALVGLPYRVQAGTNVPEKPACLQLSGMEPTGIEPATSCLQSRRGGLSMVAGRGGHLRRRELAARGRSPVAVDCHKCVSPVLPRSMTLAARRRDTHDL
jgi:hypothetical protein